MSDLQLSDVLEQAILSQLTEIHTALPAQIETYDYTTKKASVKPLIKKTMNDGTELVIPVIENVPVVFPGTGTVLIHFPLNKGDKCLLIFSERSLDEFLSLGIDNAASDPRILDLSDAICIPGLYPFVNPGKVANGNTNLEIIYNNSKIIITTNGNVEINGGTKKSARDTDPTLSNTTLDSVFWAWVATISGAVNALSPGSVPVVPTSLIGKINGGSNTVLVGD